MRMVLLVLVVSTPGCNRVPRELPAQAEEHEHTMSHTNWTDKTELFMEHPPLVAGQKARFAVHLTRLDNFRALRSGHVAIRMRAADGREDVFTTDRPYRPGIFGVDVTPKTAGAVDMTVTLSSAGLEDLHALGKVAVYVNAKAADVHEEPTPKEETIAFLKEQQWNLDFGTEVVASRTMRESIVAPGEIAPRSGGVAEVIAPFTGRLVNSATPAPGSVVKQAEVVAQILPPIERPADLSGLELERSQAQTASDFARRDRERAQRLLDVGAVPARRLEEARTAEAAAQARLRAAEQQLNQYETARRAAGAPAANRVFLLRAPITGVVTLSQATPGGNVESGQTLFRIVDVQTVYAAANVPESELPKLHDLTGAELEAPGGSRPIQLGRPLSVGRIVDPESRTVRVVYPVRNAGGQLAVGQAVSLRLLMSQQSEGPAVPESAVVDDAGRPIVFVQLAGESFARRPVRLGVRQSNYVRVLEGVRAGERVVTRGANLIRLASLSSQVPAHGHVH